MHSPFSLLTHFTSIFNYSLTFCIILHAFLLKRLNVYRRFPPRSQSSPLFRRCCFCCWWFFFSSLLFFVLHFNLTCVCVYMHKPIECCFFAFIITWPVLCTMSGDITHILTQTQPFTYFININLNTYRFATLVSMVCSPFSFWLTCSLGISFFALSSGILYDVQCVSLQTCQIGRLLLCIQISCCRCCRRRGCCRYSTPPLFCSCWSVFFPFAWNKLNLRKETGRMGQQERTVYMGMVRGEFTYQQLSSSLYVSVRACVCVNMQNVNRECNNKFSAWIKYPRCCNRIYVHKFDHFSHFYFNFIIFFRLHFFCIRCACFLTTFFFFLCGDSASAFSILLQDKVLCLPILTVLAIATCSLNHYTHCK